MGSYDVRSGTPGRSATPPKAAGGPARRINHELARLYPVAHIELDFTAPLELLEWRVAPKMPLRGESSRGRHRARECCRRSLPPGMCYH